MGGVLHERTMSCVIVYYGTVCSSIQSAFKSTSQIAQSPSILAIWRNPPSLSRISSPLGEDSTDDAGETIAPLHKCCRTLPFPRSIARRSSRPTLTRFYSRRCKVCLRWTNRYPSAQSLPTRRPLTTVCILCRLAI